MTLERPFQVDGKPFFPLGGQSRNSSGYNDLESEAAFQAVKLLHGNTLEIPVYWEQVEPEEGRFDFTSVKALLDSARRHEIKLVLLWFGTWKNGNMEYVPGWVKINPQRFKRVQAVDGSTVWVLSSHCAATFEADQHAFCALCQYLADHDAEQIVIAVQIENEPGILGSERDYGPEAEATLTAPVPEALIEELSTASGGPVHALWQGAGGRTKGNWLDLFGEAGGELMTAWSIATFIERLAQAGKTILDRPMYLNVWLGEGGFRLPGESYPSGGAVTKVLDLYKWATPHIDLIAPDIYIADVKGYEAMCAAYSRPDNPFFIPESAPGGSNAWLLFRAIADYNAVGYCFFAIEHILDEDGGVRPALQPLVDSFHCVTSALPLILRYQGSGKLHAVVQEEGMGAQTLDLDGYTGVVYFGDGSSEYVGKDWRHPNAPKQLAANPTRGRGLVIQTGLHEFYLVGANIRLFLRPKAAPEHALHASHSRVHLLKRLAHYVRIEEGVVDEDGVFHVRRRRNGDETDHGVWVEPDVGVVHVVMCE